MSKKQGFWANLLGIQPERERFSLEELKHLHDVLQQNATVTDNNKELVVETLRSIAELMIWYIHSSCRHHALYAFADMSSIGQSLCDGRTLLP